jgi:tRNA-Thr(GGU) m(6)t(6)A37 methyltransferase TsaA
LRSFGKALSNPGGVASKQTLIDATNVIYHTLALYASFSGIKSPDRMIVYGRISMNPEEEQDMSQEHSTYHLRPIGHVRQSEGMFRLKILPPYRPALKGLGEFSHVHVIWWADQHDNDADRAIMQADLPYAPGTIAGMFACRSPLRPNPIAITTMLMLDVDEANGVVTLPWIDARDGTPVLDLKPYIPISDRIRDVHMASWLEGWPVWMEDAAAFFAEHEVDFGD